MRVLVTGGAGYIGSVVVEVLCQRGHQVAVLDNLSKGHRDAIPDDIPFIHCDLRQSEGVRAALRRHGAEAVVHLAADSLVGESVTDPGKYYRNNVLGGLSLFDAMVECGVGRLVFSSTAAVYGEPERQPITEDAALCPTNPYGETKLALEKALRWYERAGGLRAICLRYFNAAGATERCGERHDPETHLIPRVLMAARDGTPVTVFGTDYPTPDGTCLRDYIHVRDLATAHALALDALAAGAPGASYNLGCGGEGYSVQQVIDAARRITGRAIAVEYGPRRAGDPAALIASSDRARAALGWRPEMQALDEIVASAWRFMSRP